MAVLDAQATFSNLANGDSPTAIADNASANYYDQMQGGLNYSAPGGGAYIAPWIIVRVITAFAGTSSTIIAVLQDAPEPSTTMVPTGPATWTDRLVGPTFTTGGAVAPSVNTYLLAARIPPSLDRYVRVIYRIAVNVMTAGNLHSFLTLDHDIIDIAMRKASTFVTQSGQVLEAVGNSIAAS